MSLPDQTPKLPKLPFLIGDVALLAAAWYIADRHPDGLPSSAVAAITACVAVGAILGAIPFLADYARKQDEALDERQRGLEALARTINSAAEQISIAAGGFNEIADLAHKNLRQAEHLPHKLQEKIAEFNALLENAHEDDREELEKEVSELRAAESERLAATAARIEKAVAELGKLEAAIQKQLAARTELLTGVTDALAAASANIVSAINSAEAKAIADIETALTRAPFLSLPAPEPASGETPAATASDPAAPAFKTIAKIEPVVPVTLAPFQEPSPIFSDLPPGAPSDTPVAADPPAPVEPARSKKRSPRKPAAAPAAAAETPSAAAADAAPAAESDDAPVTAAEVVERVLASDGATRLIATAYIGIGNRLFIRGDGPGLSWDRGVPLQFVSIGKWRWETADATAPVKFKLYKNDETECTALGTLTLDPGYQQEVTAKF